MYEKRRCVGFDLSQNWRKMGESAVSTASIYDVGRTTVNDIKKNANKIESHNISKLQNSDSNITAKKIVKKLFTRTPS